MPQLESTSGERASLDDLIGHAVVIFCESRGHTEVNEALKQELGRASEHDPRLRVLGVAHLHGLGRQPVRKIVSTAVRAVAAHYGVELWMDFDRVLDLDEGAHVLVLAPDGRRLFHHRGPLVDRKPFDAALSRAIQQARRSIAA